MCSVDISADAADEPLHLEDGCAKQSQWSKIRSGPRSAAPDSMLLLLERCKEFTCATHGNGACATTQHSPWPLHLACTRPACPSSDAMYSSPKHPYSTTFQCTPDPAQPLPDLTHPRHTCVSSTCRTHVPITGIPCWRSLPLIPSPPARIPSFHHACTTVVPHQQHHATHTIPPPAGLDFPMLE
jgi:hypothetical protein